MNIYIVNAITTIGNQILGVFSDKEIAERQTKTFLSSCLQEGTDIINILIITGQMNLLLTDTGYSTDFINIENIEESKEN